MASTRSIKAHRLMYGNDESKWTGWNNEAVWALAERAVGTGYTASGAASYPVYDELERGEDSMEWAPGTVAVAEACVVDVVRGLAVFTSAARFLKMAQALQRGFVLPAGPRPTRRLESPNKADLRPHSAPHA